MQIAATLRHFQSTQPLPSIVPSLLGKYVKKSRDLTFLGVSSLPYLQSIYLNNLVSREKKKCTPGLMGFEPTSTCASRLGHSSIFIIFFPLLLTEGACYFTQLLLHPPNSLSLAGCEAKKRGSACNTNTYRPLKRLSSLPLSTTAT